MMMNLTKVMLNERFQKGKTASKQYHLYKIPKQVHFTDAIGNWDNGFPSDCNGWRRVQGVAVEEILLLGLGAGHTSD